MPTTAGSPVRRARLAHGIAGSSATITIEAGLGRIVLEEATLAP